jgi:hypothetical protein
MSNQILKIINRAIKKKDKYSILTFNTHERYQTQLAKTGHDFYAFNYDDSKEWFDNHGTMPDNYYVLPKNSIYYALDFDFILSQSKFGQFQVVQNINQRLKLPVISLEHTLPVENWPDSHLENFRRMVGDINVFISDYSANKWGLHTNSIDVVKHSVGTDLFKPDERVKKKVQVLSVVHDFINRDYCLNYSGWKRITEGMPVRVVGDTEGLSKPAASVKDLVKEYQSSQVFLNTSTLSPIPMALLEAMACGCAVVSTANCMIPEMIEHGVNGLISNDETELRDHLEKLLADEDLRIKLGKAARETILKDFSESKFIDNWNKIFDRAYSYGA